MFLAEITYGNDDGRSDTLAEERPPAKYFHKYLQDKIIERKIKKKWKQVAEELYPSP